MHGLFIPSKSNGYTPDFLQANRLLFYSLFIVFLKVSILVTLVFPLEVYPSTGFAQTFEDDLVRSTNEIRIAYGLPELTPHPLLYASATEKADDLLVHDYFSHINPMGMGVSDFVEEQGYQFRVVAENLAMGFSSSDKVIDAWMDSKLHRENVLHPEYKHIGLAYKEATVRGESLQYVVQHFGAPSIVLNDKDDNDDSLNIGLVDARSFADVKTTATGSVLSVEAEVFGNVESVVAYVGPYSMHLSNEQHPNIYKGELIVSDLDTTLTSVATLPSVELLSSTGTKLIRAVDWKNTTHLLEKKQNEGISVLSITNFALIYVNAIALFFVVLIIGSFILFALKGGVKRHPHIALQSFIVLLFITSLVFFNPL